MKDDSDNTKRRHNPKRGRTIGRRCHSGHRLKSAPNGSEICFADTDNLKAATDFDPEMLYVECEKCGSPVIWSEGRAARMLQEAGIDPLELDNSCILLTDGCPVCGIRDEYAVRIFRSGIRPSFMPVHGHA